jgi:hypothetical protein
MGRILATCGIGVQLCSEAEWTNGDVGRDSQVNVFLGGFGDLLDFLPSISLIGRWRKAGNLAMRILALA